MKIMSYDSSTKFATVQDEGKEMDKFWKWREEKEYHWNWTQYKHELIGSMIEYLIEKNILFSIMDIKLYENNEKTKIEDIYKYLEDKINESI